MVIHHITSRDAQHVDASDTSVVPLLWLLVILMRSTLVGSNLPPTVFKADSEDGQERTEAGLWQPDAESHE
jgi:hypothetical protein